MNDKQLSPIINGLAPGLIECGKIKIGQKGRWNDKKTFQLPTKLDHFIITRLDRSSDDNNFVADDELMARILEKQGKEKLTRIPIMFLYDDIALNFQCRFTCYKGKTKVCSGDGERAVGFDAAKNEYREGPCRCGREKPDFEGALPCKIASCLSVVVTDANRVGGVWKFRTTSYNSAVNILSSMTLIQSVTGGALAGIPLTLVMYPKTSANPKTGAPVSFHAVTLEYDGSFEELKKVGLNLLLDNEKHKVQIGNAEAIARKMLSVDMDITDMDVVPEFFPEQAMAAAKEDAEQEIAENANSEQFPAPPPPPQPQPAQAAPATVTPAAPAQGGDLFAGVEEEGDF